MLLGCLPHFQLSLWLARQGRSHSPQLSLTLGQAVFSRLCPQHFSVSTLVALSHTLPYSDSVS